MKGKNIGWIVLAFVPFFLALGAMTDWFQAAVVAPGDLIFPLIILLLSILFLWNKLVDAPAESFMDSLSRAINGDYRARFSCDYGLESFKQLSGSFNQLMSCVERQTEELNRNRLLQSQLYENEKVYRYALELTCERVFEADLTHNRLIYGQAQYRQAFPFLNTEIFDDVIRLIAENAVVPADRDLFYKTFSRRCLADTFQKTSSSEITLEYRQKTGESEPRWFAATAILLDDKLSEDIKIIGYVKNIDERKRRELRILQQSREDGLTRLYNKINTQNEIGRFLRNEGKGGKHAVIMIDIDDFKSINDTFGHVEGDTALMKVAGQIRRLFRSTDIMGRVGGDEFLVLMKDTASADVLLDKLAQINSLFSEIRLKDESYHVGGSVGVALYPQDGTEYETLYKKADMALYYSKAHGKSRFCLYGGRYGEKYGAPDTSAIGILEESEYLPRQKPIESSSASKR